MVAFPNSQPVFVGVGAPVRSIQPLTIRVIQPLDGGPPKQSTSLCRGGGASFSLVNLIRSVHLKSKRRFVCSLTHQEEGEIGRESYDRHAQRHDDVPSPLALVKCDVIVGVVEKR